MPQQSRRSLVRTTAAVATLASAGLAGCLSTTGVGRDAESVHTPPGNLTAWDETPDCVTSGEHADHDGMYDSKISVTRVTDDLGGGYAPIRFSSLSDAEQELLGTVTTEGGYATCDTSDAFDRFVDRVGNASQRQDDRTVHLKRDDSFYGLYVEVLDQVYSY